MNPTLSSDLTPEMEQAMMKAGQENAEAMRYVKQRKGKNVFEIGRNDPCMCGSGKKYKKCCLQ